jgi:hypothetical protein
MATPQNALICALLALALWSCIGLAVGKILLPRSLALLLAPTLGWAVHSVLALPLLGFAGMARPVVIAVMVGPSIGALMVWLWPAARIDEDGDAAAVPLPAMVGAALLACLIMAIILPTVGSDGATLAGPVFDHAKIAMIDDMARLGVPAGNPFFQESGGVAGLSYYYLWHFSAAELAVLTGCSGWEADAGMTGFTALSSLSLMMGFAVWLGSRASAAYWVLVLAATAAIRFIPAWFIGWKGTGAITGWPTGFAGWLFQVTWAPQHVASAGSAVVAIFLLIRMAERQSWPRVLAIALLTSASFESSTWVGGVTFPLAAIAIGLITLIRMQPQRRGRYVLLCVTAATLAVALSSPFIADQFRAALARGDAAPIAIMPYDILGDEFPETVRDLLDVPAFWCIFLLIEFAAYYPAGFIFAAMLARDRWSSAQPSAAVAPLALLALISLGVGSLLVSTLAPNNDLAWRAVLPAILLLIVFTAAGFARFLRSVRPLYAATGLLLVALGLGGGVRFLVGNLTVRPEASSRRFADSVPMWAAVRKFSAVADRIANNPGYLADMTPWPVNIAWALLADRRSCYAGPDLALPFAPMTQQDRDAVETKFTRLFSGDATPDDLHQFATRYNCNLIVVTPQDGAWTKDPFAAGSVYRLVDTTDAWRIYKAAATGPEK